MSTETMSNVLIEGFDPKKVRTFRSEDNSKWVEVHSAYRNGTIMKGELVGFETLKLNKEKELCGVIRLDNIKGLIPLQESGIDPKDQQAINKYRALSGKEIAFKVLHFDEEKNMFVGSRKQARDEMKEITLRKIDKGVNVYCSIREVFPGHLIGDIGGIDVHIPVFELTYGWVDDLRDMFKTGETIEVQVTELDKAEGSVKVSAKPLMQNPFPDCATRYEKNAEYVATVSGVPNYGIFCNLEPGVDSLAPHLKFQNVQKGDRVLVRIQHVDTKKEQIRTKIVRVID